MSLAEIAPTDMIIVIGNNDGSDGDGLLGVMLVVWSSGATGRTVGRGAQRSVT
jgi:hypothetical protein